MRAVASLVLSSRAMFGALLSRRVLQTGDMALLIARRIRNMPSADMSKFSRAKLHNKNYGPILNGRTERYSRAPVCGNIGAAAEI